MSNREQNLTLDCIIKEKRWEDLFATDPTWVAKVLSFSDILTLTKSDMITSPPFDLGLDYIIRLLYALKGLNPKQWQAGWGHEVYLGSCCNFSVRYHEEYYAYMRAACLVQPTPARLAVELAGCNGTPLVMISNREAINWCLYSLTESPSLNAIMMLRSLYSGVSGKEDEVVKYSTLIEEMSDIWPQSPPFPESSEYTDFTSPGLSLEVTIRTATPSQIVEWAKKGAWSCFYMLDPRCVVKGLPFADCLRLTYRLLQDSAESKEYAVRILYVLRLLQLGQWLSDWRHNAFLGYACEVTGKWDEQFAWYEAAAQQFFDSQMHPKVAIAVAGCCFAPYFPSVTFARAIQLLEDALKQDPYIEALVLLRRIYAYTGQPEKVLEMDRAIVAQRGKEVCCPSFLPPVVTTPFVS